MEDINKLFEKFVSENVITEEAKNDIAVVFEAYVNEAVAVKVEEEKQAILESMDAKFEEVVSEHKENVQNKINDYMKHVVSEFINDNKVKIQNDIVVEKAVRIIDGIQRVFEEHGIVIPESNTTIVEEINSKNAALKAECNKLANRNMELIEEANEALKAVEFLKATSEMSEVSKERLMNLMSGLVVESVEDFRNKLETLKVSVEGKKAKKVKEEDEKENDDVEDEVEENDDSDADDKKKKEDEEAASEEISNLLNKVSAFKKK